MVYLTSFLLSLGVSRVVPVWNHAFHFLDIPAGNTYVWSIQYVSFIGSTYPFNKSVIVLFGIGQ